jgi:hypothetical protein
MRKYKGVMLQSQERRNRVVFQKVSQKSGVALVGLNRGDKKRTGRGRIEMVM